HRETSQSAKPPATLSPACRGRVPQVRADDLPLHNPAAQARGGAARKSRRFGVRAVAEIPVDTARQSGIAQLWTVFMVSFLSRGLSDCTKVSFTREEASSRITEPNHPHPGSRGVSS